MIPFVTHLLLSDIFIGGPKPPSPEAAAALTGESALQRKYR